MKSTLGLVGLLITLTIVGLLAKRQFASVSRPVPNVPGVTLPVTTPGATPQQQSEQIQQQVKQAVEAFLQQPRPIPDDK